MRVLMGLAGIGLLIPFHSQFFTATLLINIIGAGLALVLVLWEWRQKSELAVTGKTESERAVESG
jgi:hypothetical protein